MQYYMLQVYSIVVQFLKVIFHCYKILAVFHVLYNIFLSLLLYALVCTS